MRPVMAAKNSWPGRSTGSGCTGARAPRYTRRAMWIKLDDHFPEHRKLFAAARELGGGNASGRGLAVFIEGVCVAARNLTDGFLPSQIVRKLHHDPRPIEVAHVLAKPEICLWHPVEGGWQIHDYDHYNPPANVLK